MTDIDKVAEAIWQADDESQAQRPGMWGDLNILWQNYYRRMAQAAIDALKLTPEFGWDVAGRKKPNPRRIYGNDGRPVTSQPNVGDYVRLYERRTSPWVRVDG